MTNPTAIDLKIQEVEGELLVDSRLIAESLNIEHRTFMRTMDKHLTLIQELGQLRKQITTVTNSVGASNESFSAMLNEDQSTFLLTLSNNTEAVIKAKFHLVKQFSAAKKLLRPDSTALERLTAQIALEFEKDVYRPWRKVNPEADAKFRSLVALPEIPLALEPSQTASVPNTDSLLRLIDTLSLTANRAGLAGNKSTKEAEFLDKQLDKIRPQILALQADRDRLKTESDNRKETFKIALKLLFKMKAKNDCLFEILEDLNRQFSKATRPNRNKNELLKTMTIYADLVDHIVMLYKKDS